MVEVTSCNLSSPRGSEVQGLAQLHSKVSDQSGSGRHKTLSLNKRDVGGNGGVLRGGGLLQLRIRRGRRDKPWSFLIPHLIKSWSSEALAGLTGFGVEAVGGLYPLGRARRSACMHLSLKVKSGWCQAHSTATVSFLYVSRVHIPEFFHT